MRALSLILLALLAAAAPAHAGETVCPSGARLTGAPPPDGTSRGCVKQDKDGNNTKHGRWTEWFLNGQIQSQGDYINDRRAGHWTWWYPSGIKMQAGKLWDGKPVGRWSYWDENGKRLEKRPESPESARSTATEDEGPQPHFEDFSRNLKKGFAR